MQFSSFLVGKNPVLPHQIFILCVSSLLFTQNTSLWLPMCDFPHSKQFSVTPTECPAIKLNYLSWHTVRSHKLRAPSHKTTPTPLQRPITDSRSPGYTKFLSDLAIYQRFSRLPLHVDQFARATHRTQGNTMFTSLLWDKGYRWKVGWRATQGKVWDGPEHRSFCPYG